MGVIDVKNIKNITTSAVLAALFVVCTTMLHVPTAFGYIHFGDAFLFLGAYLLPMPYACAVGALGGALADIFSGFAMYAPASAIIKALMVLLISKKARPYSPKNIAGLAYGLAVNVGGYYLVNSIFFGNFISALESVPTDALQSAVSAVLFIILAVCVKRIKK